VDTDSTFPFRIVPEYIDTQSSSDVESARRASRAIATAADNSVFVIGAGGVDVPDGR
ncbi:hypothetical protein Pmar_PMAR007464, partial [Perkinsus marinus ATCC 50983]